MPKLGLLLGSILMLALLAPATGVAAIPGAERSRAEAACPASITPLGSPQETRALVPGVRLSVYAVRHTDTSGDTPERAFVSVIRVRAGAASVQPLSLGIPRLVHPQQPLRDQRTVAVMSGDYFDTMRQGDALPLGALVMDGQPAFVPHQGSRVVASDAAGHLRDTRVNVRGAVVSAAGGVLRPRAINDPLAPDDVTVAFTSAWSRTYVPDGRTSIVIKDDRVVRVSPDGKPVSVPTGGMTLWLAKDSSVQGFEEGVEVVSTVEAVAMDGGELVSASGHGGVFLRAGVVVPACSAYENLLRPRTMLAWNDAGDSWLITASTRLSDPPDGIRRGGATKTQLAQVAKALGATEAVTLDGGGSTSLYARVRDRATRIDLPADAWARPLPVVWTVRTPSRT
jgi:hypothetical protein